MPLKKMVTQIREKAAGVEARHAAVRESRPVSAVIEQRPIEELDELMDIAVNCYQHQYKHAVLQDPDAPDLPQDMVWDAVKQLLEQKYGSLRGGLRSARYGLDGGLRGLCENIYILVRDTHVLAWREHILESNVSPVDWDENFALAREFLRVAACVVPKERQIGPGELAHSIFDVIARHLERTSLLGGKRRGGKG